MTRSSGYLLRLGDDELDLHDFQRLMNQGHTFRRSGKNTEASACFRSALDLWRGPMPSHAFHGATGGFMTWAEEARLECAEMLIDSELMMGRHREVVSYLYGLIVDHPLREAFRRQLMLALYRSERQADALGVYQATRKILNSELGVEPCRALRELHHAILADADWLNRQIEQYPTTAAVDEPSAA